MQTVQTVQTAQTVHTVQTVHSANSATGLYTSKYTDQIRTSFPKKVRIRTVVRKNGRPDLEGILTRKKVSI